MRLPKEAVLGWLQNITSGSSHALMSFRYQIFRLRKAPLVWNFDNEGSTTGSISVTAYLISRHRKFIETLWLRRLFCQRSNKSFKCFMLPIKRFYVAHKIRFYIMLQHDNVLSKFRKCLKCVVHKLENQILPPSRMRGFCKRTNIKCFYDNKSENLRNLIG